MWKRRNLYEKLCLSTRFKWSRRVRNFDYLKDKEIIFLSTEVYGNGDYSVKNPDPEYMLFPHVISTSFGSYWGWEKLQEYKDLGEEEFCNKYFNGERTLGMKLQ